VAGAEFSAAIAAVHGVEVEEAERRCEALARRGQFVRSTGLSEWPDGTVAGRYAFIHALYQNVLYARIPVGGRVELHRWTGARLEQGHAERTEEVAGELAMHFTLGRDFSRAARYHQGAGRHALNQHGYREAAGHLARALDMLEALPDSQVRRQRELTLHVMLGSALLALKGHAAPEVEKSYARARELCDHVDDDPRLLPVMRGLVRFYLVRGSLDAAGAVGQRLRAMAESTGDAATSLAAHDALGHVSFYGGELEAGLAHLERAIELYDPTTHTPRAASTFRLTLDPGVSCTAHAAWTSWMLGYPGRAAARMREAVALGRSIAHPFSLAHACRFAAALHHVLRDRGAAREQAEASLAVSAGHAADGNASPYYGYGAVLMAADFHRGWVLVDQGRQEEGLAPMRAWVKTCRDTGSTCLLPSYLAWLAETYGKIGKRREGLELVGEGLDAATAFGTHYWTAELHRLRGELTDSREDAESSFVEALAIAQRQRAKSFELRAATSLSRLWVHRGKLPEAHALLAEVYAWFTEGFDTPDLTEARALLEELEAALGHRARDRRVRASDRTNSSGAGGSRQRRRPSPPGRA
jgi:predicted ATPase